MAAGNHFKNFHVEVLPPRQDAEDLEVRLERFTKRYVRVVEAGYTACITDNAMGNLSFQGTEIIEYFKLPVKAESVMIHLNTFHTKRNLDEILDSCANLGIRYILVVSGDGSARLPKLAPADIGAEDAIAVTSVELLRYIRENYPGAFTLGVVFNPYEPEDHEFEKLLRKLKAGVEFIITQPIIEKNEVVDRLVSEVNIPVVVEAWMSKKLHLLSDCVGYEIPEDTPYDPIENLEKLMFNYPDSGVYLAMLNYKRQFPLLPELASTGRVSAESLERVGLGKAGSAKISVAKAGLRKASAANTDSANAGSAKVGSIKAGSANTDSAKAAVK